MIYTDIEFFSIIAKIKNKELLTNKNKKLLANIILDTISVKKLNNTNDSTWDEIYPCLKDLIIEAIKYRNCLHILFKNRKFYFAYSINENEIYFKNCTRVDSILHIVRRGL